MNLIFVVDDEHDDHFTTTAQHRTEEALNFFRP